MNSEFHLFIVWFNARPYLSEIVRLVAARFELLKSVAVLWSEQNFSENMTRFYGTKLPKGSFKERECGVGPFTLLLVRDLKPHYENRATTRGVRRVNTNMFDTKQALRQLTGGESLIHGTTTEEEMRHDLMLLTGRTPEDFLKIVPEYPDDLEQDLIGHGGWPDLETVFRVLNSTAGYVVLRNFEYLPGQFQSGEHGDIDILCRDPSELALILNADSVYHKRYRVHYAIRVGGQRVFFDFRSVGDNYYDKAWQEDILDSREINTAGIYVPDKENYRYSLLYHAIVHKPEVSPDYTKKLAELFGTQDLRRSLKAFMDERGYRFTEPNDFSVYVNQKVAQVKVSVRHEMVNFAKRVKRTVKKLFAIERGSRTGGEKAEKWDS